MLLSIIITNYNYQAFVAQAIESALAVRYEPKEIIVVDDGSKDNSRQIIAGFGDRVHAILQKNGGQISAANTGFAACQGEIIVFLDADDLLSQHLMEEVLPVWNDNVSKVQFPLAHIWRDGALTGGMFPNFPAGYDSVAVRNEVRRTAFYLSSPTSGNVLSRAYLRQVFPIPVGLTVGVDSYINGAAPLFGDVVTLHKPLALYRIHGENQWAIRTLDVQRFSMYLNDDIVRTAFVERHARRLGFKIKSGALLRQPTHMQYKIICDRLLGPTWSLSPMRALRRINWYVRGLNAISSSPSITRSGRLALSLWLSAFVFSPRPVARWLTSLRFIPHSRPRIVTRLLEVAGQRPTANQVAQQIEGLSVNARGN